VTIRTTVEAAQVPWRPLGELFVSRGLITEEELETALAEQAATGKRLGEILVDRGLVSSPDLTSALMDQLGVEISKEEGFGSGLWAEIKRRHKRVRRDVEDAEDGDDAPPEIALVPDLDEAEPAEAFVEHEPAAETEPEPELFAAGTKREPEPWVEPQAADEPELFFEDELFLEPAPEPVAADPELEEELEEIRADYTPPVERETPEEVEPEIEPEPEPEPELDPAAAAGPAPELEPADEPEPHMELQPEAVAESDDPAALRAELEEARTDLARLQEMLADAMTALTALSAEVAAEQPTE
jgi:hypothetical protein